MSKRVGSATSKLLNWARFYAATAPPFAAALAQRRRRHPGASPARPTLQSSARSGAEEKSSASLSSALCGFRPYLRVREAGDGGFGRRGQHPAALASGRGFVAATTASGTSSSATTATELLRRTGADGHV